MHAAALLGTAMPDPGDRGGEPVVGALDDELHAAEPAVGEVTPAG